MSGDPTADGFVLWTRLAPDPLAGGGMTNDSVEVEWRIAGDDSMRGVVKTGKSVAAAALAHSVHVEVNGLEPERSYWYQFKVGKELSPIGRAVTAPKPGTQQERLKFAFASCQHWESGHWTAYKHMLAEDPEFVVFLGDYIYESAPGKNAVRRHNSQKIVSLADYRNRHALYKTDASLQKMHQHCPWIMTWDDHEVCDNYSGDVPKEGATSSAFLARRANAYQAYYEHMPLRLTAQPHGPQMQMYRSLSYGDLVQFSVLDTRQYRTGQPCGGPFKSPCPGVYEPSATITGDRQEAWLKQSLDRSPAKWNIIANQVQMARVDLKPGPDEQLVMDVWNGYDASRDRFMKFLQERKPSNPIVITGDIHSNWVSDLKTDWKDEHSPVVGTEFTGTSISSAGDGVDEQKGTPEWYRENAHLKMFNGRRGYVMMTLTAAQCRADYRTLPYVSKPDAPVKAHSSWIVENNKLGVCKA